MSESEAPEDIINPADFKSIELKISLINNTTRTRLENGKRYYGLEGDASSEDPEKERRRKNSRGTDDFSLHFVEFVGTKGLVIDAPPNTCAMGHNVTLEIHTENVPADKEVHFGSTCKVISKEVTEEKREIIELQLVQFEETNWSALKAIFSKRQDEILEFFEAVKGA